MASERHRYKQPRFRWMYLNFKMVYVVVFCLKQNSIAKISLHSIVVSIYYVYFSPACFRICWNARGVSVRLLAQCKPVLIPTVPAWAGHMQQLSSGWATVLCCCCLWWWSNHQGSRFNRSFINASHSVLYYRKWMNWPSAQALVFWEQMVLNHLVDLCFRPEDSVWLLCSVHV